MRTENPDDDNAEAVRAANEAALRKARYHRIQRQLDEALAATFPASDPVAIVTSQSEEAWEVLDDIARAASAADDDGSDEVDDPSDADEMTSASDYGALSSSPAP